MMNPIGQNFNMHPPSIFTPGARLVPAGSLQGEINNGHGPEDGGCPICAARRYQDVSSDGGVSYQTPTHIPPEESFARVRNHEMEHIRRDRAAAEARGDEVVAQRVSFTMATCHECGVMYKSGGTATTITRSVTGTDEDFRGHMVDTYA